MHLVWLQLAEGGIPESGANTDAVPGSDQWTLVLVVGGVWNLRRGDVGTWSIS